MRFHRGAKTILSQACDTCNVSRTPTSVHPSLRQLCMKCCHDKIINSFPQSYVHSTKTCTQTTSTSSAAQTSDSHNWRTLPEPMKSASRENYTTQSARYLSSFAASYLLDAPSPASQRIWIPWGRFPSYVPCAAVQQAIDLIICFKTKLLLENGNKLILQLDLNIVWTPERFSEFHDMFSCWSIHWSSDTRKYPVSIHKVIIKKRAFPFLFKKWLNNSDWNKICVSELSTSYATISKILTLWLGQTSSQTATPSPPPHTFTAPQVFKNLSFYRGQNILTHSAVPDETPSVVWLGKKKKGSLFLKLTVKVMHVFIHYEELGI